VQAIFINREKVLDNLKELSRQALSKFPEIKEIRLFGSFAKGEETGLSDIDLFIVAEDQPENPVDRVKRYYSFFLDGLKIATDIIVAMPHELENFGYMLKGSMILVSRES
jgi:predicted nucleotidyltransferase